MRRVCQRGDEGDGAPGSFAETGPRVGVDARIEHPLSHLLVPPTIAQNPTNVLAVSKSSNNAAARLPAKRSRFIGVL